MFPSSSGQNIFLVPIANCFPTTPDLIFCNENSRRRARVAVHEPIDIPAVPGILLRTEDCLYLGNWTCRLFRCGADESRHHNITRDWKRDSRLQ